MSKAQLGLYQRYILFSFFLLQQGFTYLAFGITLDRFRQCGLREAADTILGHFLKPVIVSSRLNLLVSEWEGLFELGVGLGFQLVHKSPVFFLKLTI